MQDEPIAIETIAHLEHHIRVYIAIVGGDPSKPQSPPSEGEGLTLIHLLVTLTWKGALCIASRQSLVTLQTKSCVNLWRTSARRSYFTSCMHPPAICNQHLGDNHHRVGNPNGDDQEVTFPRGAGWVPLSQPSPSPAPAQPDGGWIPQGPPPQLPRPALANPDVGHLISTLASGLCLGTHRINTFSCEAMPGKAEVSFEQWNHEVQCIKDHYPESVVQESIVQSLKVAATDMTQYMGPTVSVSEILQKINSNLWYSGIVQCSYAKFLQGYPG